MKNYDGFNDKEFMVTEALSIQNELSIDDIRKILNQKNGLSPDLPIAGSKGYLFEGRAEIKLQTQRGFLCQISRTIRFKSGTFRRSI